VTQTLEESQPSLDQDAFYQTPWYRPRQGEGNPARDLLVLSSVREMLQNDELSLFLPYRFTFLCRTVSTYGNTKIFFPITHTQNCVNFSGIMRSRVRFHRIWQNLVVCHLQRPTHSSLITNSYRENPKPWQNASSIFVFLFIYYLFEDLYSIIKKIKQNSKRLVECK
jgi:hypothetical protein